MATQNGEYSKFIRPCRGTSLDPREEPGPFSWSLENSVENGYLSLTKTFYFTMTDYAYNSTEFWAGKGNLQAQPYQIPPTEVLRSSGFPQKWDRLAEDTNYHFTGNGTLRHLGDFGRIWAFDAEYTSKNETDSDGNERDSETPPWKRKPTNVSIDLDEVECPLTAGYDDSNKRIREIDNPKVGTVGYLVRKTNGNTIVRNSAGDPINARGTKYVIKLNFTYNLKPSDFSAKAVINKIGSVNKKRITVIGVEIAPGAGRIVQLHPQYIDDWESGSFRRKRPYWEIQASIQLQMNGETFNQKLLNVGNRAKFYDTVAIGDDGKTGAHGTSVSRSEICMWRSWSTSGSMAYIQATGEPQYGSVYDAIRAKSIYDKKTKGRSDIPAFAYEQMTDMPLTSSGFLDTQAINPNSTRFGDYLMVEPLEFPREDWEHLDFPTKGVDW